MNFRRFSSCFHLKSYTFITPHILDLLWGSQSKESCDGGDRRRKQQEAIEVEVGLGSMSEESYVVVVVGGGGG